MKFSIYFHILSLFCLGPLWAQTLSREILSESEFKKAFFKQQIEPTLKEQEEKKAEFFKARIEKHLGNYKFNPGNTDKPTFEQEQRIKQFLDCIKASANSDVFKTLGCHQDWKALNSLDYNDLRRSGLPIPEDFVQRLKNEMKDYEQNLELYQKKDEVIVMEDVMKFDEVPPEVLANLQVIDPNIKNLSLDIKEIVLKISRSDNAVKAIKEQKSLGVPDELFVLGEMLEMILGQNCENEATFISTYGNGKDLLKGLKVLGDEKKKNQKETGSYILGIEAEKDPKNMLSYRFEENGTIYYLYPKKSYASTETWVMGILPPNGVLQFRYFKIQTVQPDKTSLKSQNDLSLLRPMIQQGRSSLLNSNRLYFQAQEGLVLEADEVTAPIIGKAIIPEAKLIIGRVHMAYLTKKGFHQTDLAVRHDDVMLSTESRPISNKWSLGGQFKLSPLTGNWTMNSNVRIQNYLLGYSQNSQGQNSVNVSYILSRNFLNLQAGSESKARMSLGRQFKGGKGYVMAVSDFSSIHEIKLVLNLK